MSMKRRLRDHAPVSWFFDGYGINLGGVLVIGVAFVAALVLVICGLTSVIESGTCAQAGERLGLNSNYRFRTGCYYELPSGKWIPDDRYPPKYIQVEGSHQ